MQPHSQAEFLGVPVVTPVSAIQARERPVQIKSKNQLLRYVMSLLPAYRHIRILTDSTDSRSGGFPVAICEQDQNGELTLLKGAGTLTNAASFFKVAVEYGDIK